MLEAFSAINPDIVLMDYQMPGVNGYQTAIELLTINRSAKILLFTYLDSLVVAANFLAIGGKGFITKDADLDTLFNAIITIIQGQHYFHSRHDKQLIEMLHQGIRGNLPKIQFSQRELEICLKLSKGHTAKMIADDLGLSVRTVESYKNSLISKTKVKNTVELIDFIYRNGINPV